VRHAITDKAQVSIDFPEKFYVGSFGRDSSLDVSADDQGVHINLERQTGKKRRVGFHVHYYLLADLLHSIGQALTTCGEIDEPHRSALVDADRRTPQVSPCRRHTETHQGRQARAAKDLRKAAPAFVRR
jgi:hypothetical protein